MGHRNPGSFTPHKVHGPREIAALTAREALGGHPVNAAMLGVVESTNWGMSRFGKWLPPRVRCSCCGHRGRSFLHSRNRLRTAWNSACPLCDSRSRHRALAVLIPQLLSRRASGVRVLHVAPEAVLRRVVEPIVGVYHTCDFPKEANVTYPGTDLTRSGLPESAYDVVLCNHVLEHIPDDASAVGGIARALAPDGVAVVTIPGVFTRRETVRFADNSLNGHWRDYGSDVVDLFARFFSEVETVDLHALDRSGGGLSHGIRRGETAFVMCRPLPRPR